MIALDGALRVLGGSWNWAVFKVFKVPPAHLFGSENHCFNAPPPLCPAAHRPPSSSMSGRPTAPTHRGGRAAP